MSEEIYIHRVVPIINGCVRLPECAESKRHAVTVTQALTIPGTSVGRLSTGTNGESYAGLKHGTQEFLVLPPELASRTQNSTYEALKALQD